MPSIPHEALVQLFRDAPALLSQLLQHSTELELPRHDAVTPASESIGDALPRELRCDGVFRFERCGQPVLAVILEVQLAEDPDKPFIGRSCFLTSS